MSADAELKCGRWRGQLHGVPIAVNELFDVAHLPAIYGSHALAGAVVSADAEVISALGPDLGHILTLGELARL